MAEHRTIKNPKLDNVAVDVGDISVQEQGSQIVVGEYG